MKVQRTITDGWHVAALPSHGRLPEDVVGKLTKGADDLEWLEAVVPGGIHEDLVRLGRIENPAETGNAAACKWVAETDWVWRVALPALPGEGTLRLHLAGLDTVADIYVDGRHVGSHRNCYVPFDVEVPTDARLLLVHVYSPWKVVEAIKPPEKYGGRVIPERFIRKTREDFNNFNGVHPYLTPMGLYAPATIRRVAGGEVTHLNVRSHLGHGLSEASIELAAEIAGQAEAVRFQLLDPAGDVIATAEQAVVAGRCTGTFSVEQPELWWPRGYGGQPLYKVRATLLAAGRAIDVEEKRIGLRRLAMHRPFEFLINGVPVRLWGSNLTPLQGLSHRWDSERFAQILDLVENANMTSLRIWGPGSPWPQEVFDECDRRGILAWAEFAFTWGPYPEDDDYRRQVRDEARHIVRSWHHHPSIVLWCGGNEHTMGCEMMNPGQPVFGRVLYEHDIKGVVAELDPDRPYFLNSPHDGAFANDPRVGDSHSYTHIWFVPGEQHPVLFTENTRVSSPPIHSLRRVLGDELWPEGFDGRQRDWRDSPIPPSWTKLTLGPDFALPRLGPVEQFYDTADTPEGLVYRLGAAHGEYIRRYVERYRRGRPADDVHGPHRTLGHYLWKLNDTFPMVYSATIDSFGEPNMAYYALARAYQPLLLSFDIGDSIHLWLVNDTHEPASGLLEVQLFDILKGRPIKRQARQVCVDGGRSEIVFTLDVFGMFDRNYAIHAKLRDESGTTLAEAVDFAQIERRLKFPEARFTLEADDRGVTVTADAFARKVHLRGSASGPGADDSAFGWYFADNYFDLMPGQPVHVPLLRPRNGEVTVSSAFNPHTATAGRA